MQSCLSLIVAQVVFEIGCPMGFQSAKLGELYNSKFGVDSHLLPTRWAVA